MSTQTPGQAVVAALSKQLPPGREWTEAEQVTLESIEHAADRLAVFRARFAAMAADSDSLPSSLAALSAEGRLLEGAIQKWVGTLDPRNETAKSMRHVAAANARWHRGGTG
jgi:hypothetical protein